MQTAGAVVLLPFFLPVTLLSRGFHKHTLLSLYILLSLCLTHSLSLSVSLSQSVFLSESPLSRSFPPQCQSKRAPFAVTAPVNGPHGKHTVRPESAFECLPRSWLKAMWGDAPLLSLWAQGFPEKTEDGEMLQVDQMNVYRKAVNR